MNRISVLEESSKEVIKVLKFISQENIYCVKDVCIKCLYYIEWSQNNKKQ